MSNQSETHPLNSNSKNATVRKKLYYMLLLSFPCSLSLLTYYPFKVLRKIQNILLEKIKIMNFEILGFHQKVLEIHFEKILKT